MRQFMALFGDPRHSSPKNLALAREPLPLQGQGVLTGSQIRAARALLRLSAQELADRVGLSYAAIQRAESVDGMPNMQTRNLAAIKSTLEAAGCIFMDGSYSGEASPGVRLKG